MMMQSLANYFGWRSSGSATRSVSWRSTLLPEILIVASTVILIWFLKRLLGEAQKSAIELSTLVPLFVALMGLALASAVLVLGQASRSARRLTGPAQRIVLAMQRTRRGDIAHRVHLRHGDSLKEVAAEFNLLLDWLNANPPQGAKTGSDLIEVEHTEDTEIGLELVDLRDTDVDIESMVEPATAGRHE